MVSLRVCGVVVALGLSASVAARAQAPAPKAPAIPDIGPTQGSVCPSNNAADIWVCAKEKAKAFKAPRTVDGKPDFSGFWGGSQAAHESLEAHPRTPDDGGGPSFIVDPADGKVPVQAWAEAKQIGRAHV